MPTFFSTQIPKDQKIITLDGDEAHHLSRVLRVKPGEALQLGLGDGTLHEGQILSVGVTVEVELMKQLPAPPQPYPVWLYLALLKNDKMEWVTQKATELNIQGIQLIQSRRSICDELKASKWDRLHKITRESQKQCGRLTPLHIKKPIAFEKIILAETEGLHLLCAESGESRKPILKTLTEHKKLPCHVWIGPEGGWDKQEFEMAQNQNFIFVSLGPLILRAETAAVAAMSMTTGFLQNH